MFLIYSYLNLLNFYFKHLYLQFWLTCNIIFLSLSDFIAVITENCEKVVRRYNFWRMQWSDQLGSSPLGNRVWYDMHVQSCPTLCDPMNCSPPGSSIHGIFQARILEWVAISYSRGSSQTRDQTHISWVSCIGRQILYHCATWDSNIICNSSYFI